MGLSQNFGVVGKLKLDAFFSKNRTFLFSSPYGLKTVFPISGPTGRDSRKISGWQNNKITDNARKQKQKTLKLDDCLKNETLSRKKNGHTKSRTHNYGLRTFLFYPLDHRASYSTHQFR